MEYRILGKTGLKISEIGLGGIPIQRIDRDGTRTLVRAMCDAGINYIDTARGYTVSESYLGYALEGIRDRFILATKSTSRTREAMAADIDLSLQQLSTDYIDLYQCHNPTPEQLAQITAPGGALEALLEAKAAGKIRHIGITAHSLTTFRKALELPWVETVMFPYSIVETHGEQLIAECGRRSIGFIAMKPLAGGAIEDARMAMRFIRQNPCVSVVIPGMAELRELEENIAAYCDRTPLTGEEKEAVLRIRAALGTNFCRRCNYCAPCPQGIPIPNVFLMDGYLSRYGLEDWARARYAGLGAKASDCIGCGACEDRCPYGLPIRKMMKTAAEHFDR